MCDFNTVSLHLNFHQKLISRKNVVIILLDVEEPTFLIKLNKRDENKICGWYEIN